LFFVFTKLLKKLALRPCDKIIALRQAQCDNVVLIALLHCDKRSALRQAQFDNVVLIAFQPFDKLRAGEAQCDIIFLIVFVINWLFVFSRVAIK
jgi:hypothetical protein